jgi:zinc transporter ZupT
MALLSGDPRSATIVATADSELLRIDKEDFDHLIEQSPALRKAVAELNTRHVLRSLRAATTEEEAELWQRTAVLSIQRLSRAEEATLMQQHSGGGAPLAIFLGALLDGIPESVVIGAGFTSLASLNLTFLVAVFLANLPEAMASAAGMRHGGFTTRRIFTLWGGLVVGGAIAAALGNLFLTSAPPTLLTFVEAIAGGGILAMVAATMMPEAFEQGGSSVALATIAGFLSALVFTVLGLHV